MRCALLPSRFSAKLVLLKKCWTMIFSGSLCQTSFVFMSLILVSDAVMQPLHYIQNWLQAKELWVLHDCWDPKSWKLNGLDKLEPDGHLKIVTPWTPVGAKNQMDLLLEVLRSENYQTSNNSIKEGFFNTIVGTHCCRIRQTILSWNIVCPSLPKSIWSLSFPLTNGHMCPLVSLFHGVIANTASNGRKKWGLHANFWAIVSPEIFTQNTMPG